MKVRFLLLPRNGNCLVGFQAEPGRLPFLESIFEGGENEKEDFDFYSDVTFVND